MPAGKLSEFSIAMGMEASARKSCILSILSHTLMQDKPYVPDVLRAAGHLYLSRLAEVLASDDVAGKFHKARMVSLKVMW